jgi:hypothetical protein
MAEDKAGKATASDGHLYVICDAENRLMSIDGITMFGVRCTIPAIFFGEEQALQVLFNMEEADLTERPHAVRKISDSFTASA